MAEAQGAKAEAGRMGKCQLTARQPLTIEGAYILSNFNGRLTSMSSILLWSILDQ
jgi:hypothetical protein